MTITVDREVIESITSLIDVETQMGLFYQSLVELVPDHTDTWRLLSFQHRQHASLLRAVRQTVEHAPEHFTPGKSFVTIGHQILADIDDVLHRVQTGRVDPSYAVSFAKEIEQSLLDHHLDEVLETDLEGVETMLHRLKIETQQRRETLRTLGGRKDKEKK